MEQVLASRAALAGKLLITTDDGVTDCALSLTLESSSDVLAPCGKAIDQVAVL